MTIRIKTISACVRLATCKIMMSEQYISIALINNGSCFDHARCVVSIARKYKIKGVSLRSGPGHVWIEYNKKCFDAEHNRGVGHPRLLNYYKRDWRNRRKLPAIKRK